MIGSERKRKYNDTIKFTSCIDYRGNYLLYNDSAIFEEEGFILKIYSFMAFGRICFRHYGYMAGNFDLVYSFAGNCR